MIKSELISELTKCLTHLPEQHIANGVNAILNHMRIALSHGKRIEIRGFGSFAMHERAPRQAHNPKTGEKLKTKSKKVPHFKPGKELRERINLARKRNIKIML